jgi:hypothetical protein
MAVDVGVVSEAKDHIAVHGGLHAASIAAGAMLDRSFARGSAWQGSVKWIVPFVTWATTIFVARILSPEDYGLLAVERSLTRPASCSSIATALPAFSLFGGTKAPNRPRRAGHPGSTYFPLHFDQYS